MEYNGYLFSGNDPVAKIRHGEIIPLDGARMLLYLAAGGSFETWLESRAIDRHRPNSRILKKILRLTDSSDAATVRLDLPAPDDELEPAKRALQLDSLDSTSIEKVEIGYPWMHLLSTDSVTLEDANILAQCVQTMSQRELKVFSRPDIQRTKI